MKELTELEIESGKESPKSIILDNSLEEHRAEKWIEGFFDHLLTRDDNLTSSSIQSSKDEDKDE